jgi:hypothetical protein
VVRRFSAQGSYLENPVAGNAKRPKYEHRYATPTRGQISRSGQSGQRGR